MKYVKTFENFNTQNTNEGLLWGEGSIWQKIGSWFSSWKNKEMAKGAEAFKTWAEKNPEKLEEFKAKLKPEFDKLSSEEQEELLSKMEKFRGEEPPADVLQAAEEVAKVQEKLKSRRVGSKVYESYSLILEKEELSLGKKILSWLGLGLQYIGIISMALSFIIFFTTAILFASGAGPSAIIASPLVIFGMLLGGAVTGILGLAIQYKGDPKNPNFKASRGKTGWESSGGPIM